MGRASGIGCAVEVRDRPELFRVVVRIDRGFQAAGIEPWTYLLSAGRAVSPMSGLPLCAGCSRIDVL
eukprot:scaffold2382_cov51-Phaeocystis_antarctica.AAC.2